ncbi:hypothetical protein SVAN01_02651 [Stagonosporopsis vannaccii]|nr:hypothetical protein SVAN01_02651 [Stagonosporopsis vannaccii]
MSRPCPQHLSKALTRQHLRESDPEDGDEHNTTGPESPCRKPITPRWGSAEDLLSCKSWLGQLCEEERSRLDKALEVDSNSAACQSNSNAVSTSDMQEPAHDKDADRLGTGILQRVRQGRGPRDSVAEDLLAVFRVDSLEENCAETYEDMQKVLLSWNKRVSAGLVEDQHARVILRAAVARRRSLLRRSYPGIDREKALQESTNEMLHALTALRPEVACFQTQESSDILTMMWANVRVVVPDLDDELKALTMKALIDETVSKSNAKNAGNMTGLARSLSVAQLEGNDDEIVRLKAKIQAFKQKIHETAIRNVIDRIKGTRRELAQIKLKDLQDLTELQAAQKWAAHTKLGGCQHMQNLISACDQADIMLRRKSHQQVPEMDAHVQVAQNNANRLTGMTASLFNRAKDAGFSLEHDQSSTLFDLADADIKAYVSGTVADIVDARAEAVEMLDRIDAVEAHLDILLGAAKSRYWAYDAVLEMLKEACR